MKSSPGPVRTEILLVGGGHAHVEVLRRFAMRPEPGVRLTLVAREPAVPYSGMLPGLVAGRYAVDEVHIDLARLAGYCGARLIHAAAVGIRPEERRLLLEDRPPLAYDFLSIDVGITPKADDIAGADRHALAVKPISAFWPRWSALRAAALAPEGPRRIAVVGGGAAGFELVLAVAASLRCAAPGDGIEPGVYRFCLISGGRLLSGFAPAAGRLAREALRRAGIELVEDDAAVAIGTDGVTLASGRQRPADAVLVATRAAAPAWFADTGLPLDEGGYLSVRETLQSAARDDILAAGDCAAVIGHPRPKAGVFAVRQGPVLAENLRRLARGQPARPHRPQRHFLSLLSTGDGRAIAARGAFAAAGRWAFLWKDRIDRRFMAKFNDLPEAAETAAMRCAGCAAKIGPAVLAAALDRFPSALPRDDAATIDAGDGTIRLETVDFFRSPWPDPYVTGRIAAHHAAGDILAMGGRPTTAQAIAVLPESHPRIAAEDLFQLLAGARRSFAELGTDLIGGHSAEGAEAAVGFAVSGLVGREAILRKAGLTPGDRLVLTRPIGTGLILAGAMRRKVRAADLFALLALLQTPQAEAAAILSAHGVRAATDVTGFGLAGHLVEMLEASGAAARLDLGAVPVHPAALALARAGVASTLLPDNLAFADRLSGTFGPADLALLFDPQTAGGLLAALPADRAGAGLDALRAAAIPAALIGSVLPRTAGPSLLVEGAFPGDQATG